MCEAIAKDDVSVINERVRYDLMQCAMLAGMVIAQTGTTAGHAMGYSLTYFKDIDHGRANGLVLPGYMAFVEKKDPQLITEILTAMGMSQLSEFKALLDQLLGATEEISLDDVIKYSAKAVLTGNIKTNCKVAPSEEDVKAIFIERFDVA
jgi:alcohol dehydrogenase class IV